MQRVLLRAAGKQFCVPVAGRQAAWQSPQAQQSGGPAVAEMHMDEREDKQR
jgi:hypothetical protein